MKTNLKKNWIIITFIIFIVSMTLISNLLLTSNQDDNNFYSCVSGCYFMRENIQGLSADKINKLNNYCEKECYTEVYDK